MNTEKMQKFSDCMLSKISGGQSTAYLRKYAENSQEYENLSEIEVWGMRFAGVIIGCTAAFALHPAVKQLMTSCRNHWFQNYRTSRWNTCSTL